METFSQNQDLDSYIKMFESIYEPVQNIERDFNQILARLLESIAECSQYVNKHNQQGLAINLPKVFSWYCSLVHKSGITNKLSDAIWRKFPSCCPYCLQSPCRCVRGRKSLADNSEKLASLAKDKINNKPTTLYEWQKLFEEVYPRDPQAYDQKSNFAHLIEELGEASEAYRIKYFSPTAIESELADIFTWIIGMANLLNALAIDNAINGYSNYNIAEHVFKRYPGKCPDCSRIPCSCVSIHSRQKISELNVIYPDDIIKAIDVSRIEIAGEIKALFKLPEAQNLIYDIRKLVEGNDTSAENISFLIKKLITEPSHKRWYDQITASGLAENTIVTIITMLLQNTFK